MGLVDLIKDLISPQGALPPQSKIMKPPCTPPTIQFGAREDPIPMPEYFVPLETLDTVYYYSDTLRQLPFNDIDMTPYYLGYSPKANAFLHFSGTLQQVEPNSFESCLTDESATPPRRHILLKPRATQPSPLTAPQTSSARLQQPSSHMLPPPQDETPIHLSPRGVQPMQHESSQDHTLLPHEHLTQTSLSPPQPQQQEFLSAEQIHRYPRPSQQPGYMSPQQQEQISPRAQTQLGFVSPQEQGPVGPRAETQPSYVCPQEEGLVGPRAETQPGYVSPLDEGEISSRAETQPGYMPPQQQTRGSLPLRTQEEPAGLSSRQQVPARDPCESHALLGQPTPPMQQCPRQRAPLSQSYSVQRVPLIEEALMEEPLQRAKSQQPPPHQGAPLRPSSPTQRVPLMEEVEKHAEARGVHLDGRSSMATLMSPKQLDDDRKAMEGTDETDSSPPFYRARFDHALDSASVDSAPPFYRERRDPLVFDFASSECSDSLVYSEADANFHDSELSRCLATLDNSHLIRFSKDKSPSNRSSAEAEPSTQGDWARLSAEAIGASLDVDDGWAALTPEAMAASMSDDDGGLALPDEPSVAKGEGSFDELTPRPARERSPPPDSDEEEFSKKVAEKLPEGLAGTSVNVMNRGDCYYLTGEKDPLPAESILIAPGQPIPEGFVAKSYHYTMMPVESDGTVGEVMASFRSHNPAVFGSEAEVVGGDFVVRQDGTLQVWNLAKTNWTTAAGTAVPMTPDGRVQPQVTVRQTHRELTPEEFAQLAAQHQS